MKGILLAVAVLLTLACNEVTEVPAPRATNTPLPDLPTAAPPTAAPRKALGQPVFLESRGGRFSVTANAIIDPAQSSNQVNRPAGRWVLVDWTLRNEGNSNVDIVAIDLKLLTVDGFVLTRGNHAGHREPDMEAFPTLGPGQQIRGYYVYDVPVNGVLKAALYHPSGSAQIVIADLP